MYHTDVGQQIRDRRQRRLFLLVSYNPSDKYCEVTWHPIYTPVDPAPAIFRGGFYREGDDIVLSELGCSLLVMNSE
jgi:hypothetical protein